MSRRPPASVLVEGLSHRYPDGERRALDRVGFRVEPGQRIGLLGPNGAGKTTLMRILCGYLRLQRDPAGSTRVEVGGRDVCARSLEVREQVGYLPEQVPLYPELRVREHLAFRAALKGLGRKLRAREIERVAELASLGDVLEKPVFELSRGYRQRVGIADALLTAPPLLVLDEPTVGLDPNQVQEMRAMLRGLGGAQTLILSSHILAEVEVLCDRVIVLSRGCVVADESVEEALQAGHVSAAWEAARQAVEEVIEAAYQDVGYVGTPEGTTVTQDEGRVEAELPCPEGREPRALLEALGRRSARVRLTVLRLEVGRRRLEERFARVTGAVPEEPEEGART